MPDDPLAHSNADCGCADGDTDGEPHNNHNHPRPVGKSDQPADGQPDSTADRTSDHSTDRLAGGRHAQPDVFSPHGQPVGQPDHSADRLAGGRHTQPDSTADSAADHRTDHPADWRARGPFNQPNVCSNHRQPVAEPIYSQPNFVAHRHSHALPERVDRGHALAIVQPSDNQSILFANGHAHAVAYTHSIGRTHDVGAHSQPHGVPHNGMRWLAFSHHGGQCRI